MAMGSPSDCSIRDEGFFFSSDMLAEHLGNTDSILITSLLKFYCVLIIGLKSGHSQFFLKRLTINIRRPVFGENRLQAR